MDRDRQGQRVGVSAQDRFRIGPGVTIAGLLVLVAVGGALTAWHAKSNPLATRRAATSVSTSIPGIPGVPGIASIPSQPPGSPALATSMDTAARVASPGTLASVDGGHQVASAASDGGRIAPFCADTEPDDRAPFRRVQRAPDDDSRRELYDIENSRVELEEKVDLNGDGFPDWIVTVPELVVRDASWYQVYVNCGDETFFQVFQEYGAAHEVASSRSKGWRKLELFTRTSTDHPSRTHAIRTTYRFDGENYVEEKHSTVPHRLW